MSNRKGVSIVLGLFNILFGILLTLKGKELIYFGLGIIVIGVITLLSGLKKKGD